jgi:hypothetical protein
MARTPRTRTLGLLGGIAVLLTACQNPFPELDASAPPVVPTGDQCANVAAFSQRPHQDGDNGDQTQARMINAENPSGSLLLEYFRGNDAQLAVSAGCTWVAVAPTNGELWKINTKSGEKILVDGGRWLGVAIDESGSIVASSLDTPWVLITFDANGSQTHKQLVGQPDAATQTTHKGKPAVRNVWTRMENGWVDGGAHIVVSDWIVDSASGLEISRSVKHYRIARAGAGDEAGLKRETGGEVREIKGSKGCRRYTDQPGTKEVGLCLSWNSTGQKNATNIRGEIREGNGKTLAVMPTGLAELGILPEITSDDRAVVPRADIWWLNDKQLGVVVAGRQTDDAFTPKDGTGLFSVNVWDGQWTTTQITKYAVQRWAAATA